jgi:hypothetical protein
MSIKGLDGSSLGQISPILTPITPKEARLFEKSRASWNRSQNSSPIGAKDIE